MKGRWLTAPRRWTLAFSVVALALALGSAGRGSRYDPSLAVLTATLIAVLWYTCFTYEAVEHGRALAYRAQEVSSSTLSVLVRQILEQLSRLPKLGRYEDRAERLVRQTTVWREDDLDQIQRTANYLGPSTGRTASHAVVALRWLKARIAEVRAVDPARGYRWSQFPWDEWTEKMGRAETDLGELLTMLER